MAMKARHHWSHLATCALDSFRSHPLPWDAFCVSNLVSFLAASLQPTEAYYALIFCLTTRPPFYFRIPLSIFSHNYSFTHADSTKGASKTGVVSIPILTIWYTQWLLFSPQFFLTPEQHCWPLALFWPPSSFPCYAIYLYWLLSILFAGFYILPIPAALGLHPLITPYTLLENISSISWFHLPPTAWSCPHLHLPVSCLPWFPDTYS